MALDIKVVKQRSEAILRVVSTDEQIQHWANQYSSYRDLDTFLVGTAQADVFPTFRLYQASFGRIPDDKGLDFWVKNYDATSVTGVIDLAVRFSKLPEWNHDFDGQTRSQSITQVYLQLLGREPDADGLSYWVNSKYTLPEIVGMFTFEPEFTIPANEAISCLLLSAADGNPLPCNESLRDSRYWPEHPHHPDHGHHHHKHYNLTVNTDTINLRPGDTVSGFSDSEQNHGNSDTYNGSDSITGTKCNEFELRANGTVDQAARVRNVEVIDVVADGNRDTSVNARNWNEISEINLKDIQKDFHLYNIQDGKTQINVVDTAHNNHNKIKLSYASDDFGCEANIGVKDAHGSIHLNTGHGHHGSIKTINLTINDEHCEESTLKDFKGHETETLNIKNGEHHHHGGGGHHGGGRDHQGNQGGNYDRNFDCDDQGGHCKDRDHHDKDHGHGGGEHHGGDHDHQCKNRDHGKDRDHDKDHGKDHDRHHGCKDGCHEHHHKEPHCDRDDHHVHQKNPFTITGPLDSTLTEINASRATSDLNLNTSETFTHLKVLLGRGDDILETGDTLGTGDYYDGGAGRDRIEANFTSVNDPSRTPTIRNVESLGLSFQSPIQLNGSNIDKDLHKIDLYKSAARVDLNDFGCDLKEINVKCELKEGLEVDYRDNECHDRHKDCCNDLTVNFRASAGNAGNKTALRVINADTLNVNFLAAAVLHRGIQVDDSFSGHFTEKLNITNKSHGNAVVGDHFGTAIVDGNTIKEFKVETERDGDLKIGDYSYASLAEADKLQHLKVESACNSEIDLGAIGTSDHDKHCGSNAANDLETVRIKADNYSKIRSWGIDADNSHGRGNVAATVTSINVTGGHHSVVELNGSTHELKVHGHSNILHRCHEDKHSHVKWDVDTYGYNWLQAASIGVLNIDTDGCVKGNVTEVIRKEHHHRASQGLAGEHGHRGKVVAEFKDLIGLDLESQSQGVINVKGDGSVTGFWFQDQVVKTINAEHLRGEHHCHGEHGNHHISEDGFEFYFGKSLTNALGLDHDAHYDFAVLTTKEASHGFTFNGSNHSDYVVGTNSHDHLHGNCGNDFLIGNDGNDHLTGGEGNDILVGDFIEGGSCHKHRYGELLSSAKLESGESSVTGEAVINEMPQLSNNGSGNHGHPGHHRPVGGNDIINGGDGNDIIIGGGQTAKCRDILTGGCGSDKFVFNLDDDHQGKYSETGKSTLQWQTVYNDIITDFTVGGDVLVLDVDHHHKVHSKIALYNGDGYTGGWSLIGTSANNHGEAFVNVVVRQGTYSGEHHDGVFHVDTAHGKDFQVLFMANGRDFKKTDFDSPGIGSGQNLYNEAAHEIALVGAASSGGSLSQADIIFV